MVFCNKAKGRKKPRGQISHNPYFNRWFSAIKQQVSKEDKKTCHNPYFNRWFSAIEEYIKIIEAKEWSQSLF